MKTLKTLLNRASEQGYLEKKNFEKYRIPKLVNSIPEFISESEMDALFLFSKSMKRPGHQLAVYYFLLSCYAGFRISDLKKFNYKQMVQNNTILIRAKKNGSIVSIPIYNKLNEILEEIKDKPLYLSEQKVREYVKEVAQFVGISRKIKIHTARHSFAMMMVNRGLSLDDVAELLGDSTTVAKVYARISNSRLKKEILEKMN
jgi:site-specific recombinase XerD